MTLQEIRESGLLELYLIGSLDAEEQATVEKALSDFPELQEELRRISASLEGYARFHEEKPRAGLKNSILKEAGFDAKTSNQAVVRSISPVWRALAAGFALITIALGYLLFQEKEINSQNQLALENINQTCDSIHSESRIQIAALTNLADPNNNILAVSATPKFATTDLYFYRNDVDKKNYIRVVNLPPIDDATQSFQLWSIKGSDAPIPLDVFQSEGVQQFQVSHVEDTDVYAITIEPRGGSQSPTLENLVGTFSSS